MKQYFSSSNLSSVKLHETEECSSFTFLAVSLFRVCVNSKAENCFLLIPQYSCNTFPPLRSLLVFPGPCLSHLPKTCKEQQRFLAGSYSETTCFCRRPQNRGLNGPTNIFTAANMLHCSLSCRIMGSRSMTAEGNKKKTKT